MENTALSNHLKELFQKHLFKTDGIKFSEGDTVFKYHIWESKHGFGHIYYEKGIITQYSPVTGGHVTVARY